MAQWLGIRADYEWYDQTCDDPLSRGAAAALYIGDAAHRQASRTDVVSRDLAALWRGWTGLPFVFALWQTPVGRRGEGAMRRLASEIAASRTWSFQRLEDLAARFEEHFRWPAAGLVEYWGSLDYGWNDELASGLLEFYGRAAELGEVRVPERLVFLE
jgi:chorismate dehydratase